MEELKASPANMIAANEVNEYIMNLSFPLALMVLTIFFCKPVVNTAITATPEHTTRLYNALM